ncbi:MAG: biopolymer transporter ExbB [bacterium (Candidatus Ratteibacteria) CG_4_10_14_3_um_filter_41_18]|uniref:Biopolymer transporter ExbB n=4 Tax=Candidatus Ratteibacteria TaxID=2979319 RepID=A0A2M7EAI1_9BACT|nr:MAG: hypothetical protein AUJ76_02680 [Candidatus Omnitrophica bacterium CG1_02_41_171]PIV64695.1 MAG: biopolymer transporter ExbB [bacterium (Candidatus Ratteibacteria) CG01_land_8_20_14_3_00_40_19]PIW34020.1 MAG: biopolymer transporter ExbB [bacterium (Candidatus Ratteibacteria) CG15_BIG_FIL_POST_REV_8_21_14_020_41_12]PIX76877.1 MAG: biopolymer transporter ExbB [bacterium (Candidatus Ratteibacteria) CG_4_10_14_3_um_filter_41_18]PJA61804.1 MAG: biopolymer transporter ExbB [bacterium (Candid
MLSLFEMLVKGGILMVPIIFCSVLSLAIIVERAISLNRVQINSRELMGSVEDVLQKNKILEAISICEKTRGPIPRVLKVGILKRDRSHEEIKEAMEDAASFEVPYLEKYLAILVTIATIAPLLGLLGTVTGLIRAFMVIQLKGGLVNPGDLAQGIWEALITTVAGLTIAIPTYIAYNYFVSRVNNFITEMEKSTTRLLDIFSLREKEEGE